MPSGAAGQRAGSTRHTISTISTIFTDTSVGMYHSAQSLTQDEIHHTMPAQAPSSLQADIVRSQRASASAAQVVQEHLEAEGAETVRRTASDDTLPLEGEVESTEIEGGADLALSMGETAVSPSTHGPGPPPVLPPSPAARHASSGSTEPVFLLPVDSAPAASLFLRETLPVCGAVAPCASALQPAAPPSVLLLPPPSPRTLLRSPNRPRRPISPTDRMIAEMRRAREDEERQKDWGEEERRKAREEEQRREAREEEERRRRHYDYPGRRRPPHNTADDNISPSERLRLMRTRDYERGVLLPYYKPPSPPPSRARAKAASSSAATARRTGNVPPVAAVAVNEEQRGEESLKMAPHADVNSSLTVPSSTSISAAVHSASVKSHVHLDQIETHQSGHLASPRPRDQLDYRWRSPPRGFFSPPMVRKADGQVTMREPRRAPVPRDSLSPPRKRFPLTVNSGSGLSVGSEERGGEATKRAVSRGTADNTTIPAPCGPAHLVGKEAAQGDVNRHDEVGKKGQGDIDEEKEKASSQLDARIVQAEQEDGYW